MIQPGARVRLRRDSRLWSTPGTIVRLSTGAHGAYAPKIWIVRWDDSDEERTYAAAVLEVISVVDQLGDLTS